MKRLLLFCLLAVSVSLLIGQTINTPNALIAGSLKTADPTGGTAQTWKVGSLVTGVSVVLIATNYLQVEVNGVAYKTALVQ